MRYKELVLKKLEQLDYAVKQVEFLNRQGMDIHDAVEKIQSLREDIVRFVTVEREEE
jgi:hypothetical protein